MDEAGAWREVGEGRATPRDSVGGYEWSAESESRGAGLRDGGGGGGRDVADDVDVVVEVEIERREV